MKRIPIQHRKWLVLGVLALVIAHAKCYNAQSQGTGNRQFTVNNVPIKMVYVKGGEMSLGCNVEQSSCKESELPIHTVSSTFGLLYWGRRRWTQAQWIAVMGRDNNPIYRKRQLTLPVERVSWAECQRYVNRLNKCFSR